MIMRLPPPRFYASCTWACAIAATSLACRPSGSNGSAADGGGPPGPSAVRPVDAGGAAAAAAIPPDFTFEGPVEILYRGKTAHRRRALVGIKPDMRRALVTLDGECHGEPPRCGPPGYLVIDYAKGALVEQHDVDPVEISCPKVGIETPPPLGWSRIWASFGGPAEHAREQPLAVIAPDQKHVAYKTCGPWDGEIVLADGEGKRLRTLAGGKPDGGLPTSTTIRHRGHFSPDSRRYAWTETHGDDAALYVAEIASGAVAKWHPTDGYISDWDWSKSGEQIYAALSKPGFRSPKEVCVGALAAADVTKPPKPVFCAGAWRGAKIEVDPEGKRALLFGREAADKQEFAWLDLATSTAKTTGAYAGLTTMPLPPGAPLIAGLASEGVGAQRRERLVVRDLEKGKDGSVRWSPTLACSGGGAERPLWIDARRALLLCQGIGQAGISEEFALVAADLATAAGR